MNGVVRGEGNPIGMYRKGEFKTSRIEAPQPRVGAAKRRISTILRNRRGEFRMTGIEAP